MPILFDTVLEVDQDIARNIVKIHTPMQTFSDLIEDNEDANIAEKAIIAVMKNTSSHADFHYTASIGFPFETDNFMGSRFSDGTFPVWYGSMDIMTTIYETTHHMIKTEMALENIQNISTISRERIIYDVQCQTILIDLTRKKRYYPDLVADSYQTTQAIGKQLSQQGFPGLLSPSARHHRGVNANIFKQDILSQPRISCELTYRLFPQDKKVKVYKKNRIFIEIPFD